MAVYDLVRDAMNAAHVRGIEWLAAGEVIKEVLRRDPTVNIGTIRGELIYHCINNPSKKHSPNLAYRSNPLFVTDDPNMRGKRYRLLAEAERQAFLAHLRDDLETISYEQLKDWLANPQITLEPQTTLDEQVTDELELEEIAGPALLELHLQDYLFRNWNAVFPELKLYNGTEGREYRTQNPSVGIIDFLCVDRKGNFVVIETKRNVPDRQAVGQITGYMGWVRQKLCTQNQAVTAILIAGEASDQLRLAASAIPGLAIHTYSISFTLTPV